MVDKITNCNQALGHIKAGTITSFEEDSLLAKYCRIYYDTARQSTLEAYDWSFARKRSSLAVLVEEPPDSWQFRYGYPANSVKARYISKAGIRRPRVPIPFGVELDAAGQVKTILCDEEDAILVHTLDVTNTALFTPTFEDALSWRLGAYLAVAIAGRADDEKRCFDWWQFLIDRAAVYDANEGQDDEEPDGEFVEARA